MPKLPDIPHLNAVRAFEKAGFKVVRQGKHIVMSDGRRILTIPDTIPSMRTPWVAWCGTLGYRSRSSRSSCRSFDRPSNDELQRTSDGYAAGSPLNSVFYGPVQLNR